MPSVPSVPYQPYPDARPADIGTPNVSVNAPSAAFGSTIGAALESVGAKAEHVGDELFARAVALQNLQNETEAKEADANYMVKVGDLHANYSALQGKAAVDAYPGYVKGIQKLRQDMRGGLSNDMARRMFDSQSLGTMGRTIFNGAGHAAAENKQWALGTAKAQIDLDAKTVEDNPGDDILFANKLKRVRTSAGDLATLQGFEEGSPQDKDLQLKVVSKLWAQRITGLARTQPFEAGTMLDSHAKEMTEDDRLRVDNIVRSQGRAVGSANIANEVYAAGAETDKAPAKPLEVMEKEAIAKAREVSPDDPLLEKHAVAALHGLYNQNRYAKKQEQYGNEEIIAGAIQKGVLDERQLRMDPKVAAAIDALPKDKQLAIPGQINRYNDAKNKVTNQDTYQRLYGLSNNDVEAFLNTDLTKEQLNQTDLNKLQKQQQLLKKDQSGDPRVNRAMTQIRGAMGAQLEALGIYSRGPNNHDDYDHFTGALQAALDLWTEAHGKPATYKDVVEQIAPAILRQRDVPGAWWGTNKEPFFKPDTNSKRYKDFAAEYKAARTDSDGIEPSDAQIDKAYTRMQLMGLYGKPRLK